MKIDFHSHILPNLDDGSRSVEESVAILDKMAEDGVDIVSATPHFYSSQTSIDEFIKKRGEAYKLLEPSLKPNHPKIILGAEVLYSHFLTNTEELNRLCLEGTDYLLLEMPYRRLTDDIIEDVDRIISGGEVKLLIAHIERYLNYTSYRELENLMKLDVLGQINACSLSAFTARRDCLKLAKNGFVHVLGTDFHRIDSGHKVLGEGEKFLSKKLGEGFIEEIRSNGEKILQNVDIDDIFA